MWSKYLFLLRMYFLNIFFPQDDDFKCFKFYFLIFSFILVLKHFTLRLNDKLVHGSAAFLFTRCELIVFFFVLKKDSQPLIQIIDLARLLISLEELRSPLEA